MANLLPPTKLILEGVASGALLAGEKYVARRDPKLLYPALLQALLSIGVEYIRIQSIDDWVKSIVAPRTDMPEPEKAKIVLGILNPIYCSILYSILSGISDIDSDKWWIRLLESFGAEAVTNTALLLSIDVSPRVNPGPFKPSPQLYSPKESYTCSC